jgi:hypothetical protein
MNLLLEISSQTGSSSAAKRSLQTFREALHLGLEPNLTTLLALLRAHVKSLDGSVLYDITDYLEQNQGILKISDTQDIFFVTVAMTTARNMLDHELAMRLRRLCDRDNWMLCQNLTLFVSYYLTTITGRVPIETLKEEYSHFVPDVVLPMEWVYGVMFRACEEQENLTFALELWNREGMRERVYVELGLCVWYPCRHVEVPCQYSQRGDSVSVLRSHVQESVSLGGGCCTAGSDEGLGQGPGHQSRSSVSNDCSDHQTQLYEAEPAQGLGVLSIL